MEDGDEGIDWVRRRSSLETRTIRCFKTATSWMGCEGSRFEAILQELKEQWEQRV
jgi:hypothetical protein